MGGKKRKLNENLKFINSLGGLKFPLLQKDGLALNVDGQSVRFLNKA